MLPKASYPITKKIWLDGKLISWKKAQIHVLSHALHYGSSAFEGIRFYTTDHGPAVFRLKEHTARLFYSASNLGIKIPFSQKAINEAILKTVKINKIPSGYIRPIVFLSYGKMGLNPTGVPIQTAIACWSWESYLGGKPIRVKTSRFIRIHPNSLIADAKVGGHYVNSILASLEIQKAKFDEALFLDFKGNVAEGPGENIFFVKNGVLHTPKLGAILAGITRDSILQIAKNEKIKVCEGNYKLKNLYQADELFFTGTAAEVQPIGSLDNKKINQGKIGPITTRLREIFFAIVSGKDSKYKKWLTQVA
jgi:branched-chain amino acid aminotransferase